MVNIYEVVEENTKKPRVLKYRIPESVSLKILELNASYFAFNVVYYFELLKGKS